MSAHIPYSISYRIKIVLQNFIILRVEPSLWIRDILLRIQIRVRGSVPLTNGSGSCYFRP
jgi:hypothetical protein